MAAVCGPSTARQPSLEGVDYDVVVLIVAAVSGPSTARRPSLEGADYEVVTLIGFEFDPRCGQPPFLGFVLRSRRDRKASSTVVAATPSPPLSNFIARALHLT